MHIDKSTPKAHKNNNVRVYAFGHNLLHLTYNKSIPTHTFKVRYELVVVLSKCSSQARVKGVWGKSWQSHYVYGCSDFLQKNKASDNQTGYSSKNSDSVKTSTPSF